MGARSFSPPPKGVPASVTRTPVLLPGYLVRGTIAIPAAEPHALWWTAYLGALLRGADLASLSADPPWPVPADPLLPRQLLCELLAQRWLQVDFASGAWRVREDLRAEFARAGEAGLAAQLNAVKRHKAEWWMDALSGTLLRRQTAQQYDYDHRPLGPGALQPQSRLRPQVLLDALRLDMAELLRKSSLSLKERVAARDLAYLDGPLQLDEARAIQFLVYGDRDAVLPEDLAELVPGLRSHAPQVLSPPLALPRGEARAAAVSPPARAASARPPAPRTTAPAAVPPSSPAPVPTDPLLARVMADMIRVPAGRFHMGDDRVPEERPRHPVRISRDFYLGRYLVTQALWQAVMGELPALRAQERHPQFPVIQISHQDMQDFLARLNQRPGGGGFGLPTEAQWEYACRAGSTREYCFGDLGRDRAQLDAYAWHKDNAGGHMHPVGQLRPNAWGFFDMHGLCYEALQDGLRGYSPEEVVDPIGPLGRGAGARGGAWGRSAFRGPHNKREEHFRCASRQHCEKSHRVSFRLVRELEPGA